MDTRGRVCSPESLATPNILADDPSAPPSIAMYLYKYRAKSASPTCPLLGGGGVPWTPL